MSGRTAIPVAANQDRRPVFPVQAGAGQPAAPKKKREHHLSYLFVIPPVLVMLGIAYAGLFRDRMPDAGVQVTEVSATEANEGAAPAIPATAAEEAVVADPGVAAVERAAAAAAPEVSALAVNSPRWAEPSGGIVRTASSKSDNLAKALAYGAAGKVKPPFPPAASLPGGDVTGSIPVPTARPDVPAPKAATKAAAAAGGRNARITNAVNLRSSPSSRGAIAGVIPKGATVTLHGCKGWCKVSHDGKTGYVYKSFVAGR